MKKILPLLLINCFVYFIGNAQKQVRELKWQDFMKSVQTTIIADPVPNGDFTIFQITGINKFLYRVEISGSVFELQTPVPTELQSLFRLTPTELQKTVENKKAEQGAAVIPKAFGLMGDLNNETQNELKRLQNNGLPKSAASTDSFQHIKNAIDRRKELAEGLDDLIQACKRIPPTSSPCGEGCDDTEKCEKPIGSGGANGQAGRRHRKQAAND